MHKNTKTLIVITGYTGVGKTKIAIELAKLFDAEIVSCDSLLVYKNLDIGTAKPSVMDRGNIKHHCIDLVNPEVVFDIQQYTAHTKYIIENCKKNILVVGGTGFYLKGFYAPVIDNIVITPEAEQIVNNISNFDEMVAKLIELNGENIPIDLKNPRRVSSTLKRCLSSKQTYKEMNENFQKQRSAFDTYKKYTVLLTRDDEDLKNCIHRRTETMLNVGLINEVELLLKNQQFNSINRSAIGYRETIAWLSNKTTTEQLADEICRDTWKLVKKQKTWFRKQIPIDVQYDLTGHELPEVIYDLSQKIAHFWYV